jgi:hypothetical protein
MTGQVRSRDLAPRPRKNKKVARPKKPSVGDELEARHHAVPVLVPPLGNHVYEEIPVEECAVERIATES